MGGINGTLPEIKNKALMCGAESCQGASPALGSSLKFADNKVTVESKQDAPDDAVRKRRLEVLAGTAMLASAALILAASLGPIAIAVAAAAILVGAVVVVKQVYLS